VVRQSIGGAVTQAADCTVVDEGWGRKAVEFATFSEPADCREYARSQRGLAGGNSTPPSLIVALDGLGPEVLNKALSDPYQVLGMLTPLAFAVAQ
jgi:hypothetical protein